MSEGSPYDATRCVLCGTELLSFADAARRGVAPNCRWRAFPGLCTDCAPRPPAGALGGTRALTRRQHWAWMPAPRRCWCGVPVASRAHFCEEHGREARRRTWRKYKSKLGRGLGR